MNIEQAYAAMGITLKPMGGRWVAPCPYHVESKPSFIVYTDGSYYCFGCGAYGTFTQIQEAAGSEYRFFPDLSKVRDNKAYKIGTAKKRLESDMFLRIEDKRFMTKRKVYDAFDLLFIAVQDRLDDPESDIISILLFIKTKYSKICSFIDKNP